MKDFKEFLSNNENRNLWFSAMACGMTLAIVIFAVVCSCSMLVYGLPLDDLPSDAVYWFTQNGVEKHYGYPQVILLKKSNGLADALCVDTELKYYGYISGDSFSNSGGRLGTIFTPSWAEDGVTYYHIQDLVWVDQISDVNCLVFSNEEYAIKSLTDSSFNQYADNFSDIVTDYNDDIQKYIKNFYFSSISDVSAQYSIEMADDTPNTIRVEVTPISFGYISGYTGVYAGTTAPLRTISNDVWSKVSNDNRYIPLENLVVSSESPIANLGRGTLLCSDSERLSSSFCRSETLTYSLYRGLYWHEGSKQTFSADSSSIFNGKVQSYILNADVLSYKSLSNYTCAYELLIEIFDSTSSGNVGAGQIYLLGNVDGTTGNFIGVSQKKNQSQTILSSDNQITSVNSVSSDGLPLSLDNGNVIEYVKSGMGLGGQNGLIMLIQQTFNFVPKEIWGLVFAGLALSIVLMVVKILRGMG